MRKAIQLLGSILGRKNISSPNDSAYFANTFVRRGCENCASARFAMHAGQLYISGNLFHYAVEMLLKTGLANNGTSLSEGAPPQKVMAGI